MKTTKKKIKLAVVELAERILQKQFPSVLDDPRICLFRAVSVLIALKQHGIRGVLQAGTCQWPRRHRHEDDGIIDTNFSFMWEPDSEETQRRLAAGFLPEMHCWVGIPETSEIVDTSTGDLPKQAKLTGADWPGPKPPKFFWSNVRPDWVVYIPSISACETALGFLRTLKNEQIQRQTNGNRSSENPKPGPVQSP